MGLKLWTGNLYLVIELMLAELIFLYPAPKRKGFAWRLMVFTVLAAAVSVLIPRFSWGGWAMVLRSTMVFCLSMAAMHACFALPTWNLLSLCMAGYGAQHIGWRLCAIVLMTPLGAQWANSSRLVEVASMALVYLVVFLTYGRYSARHACWRNSDKRLNAVSALIFCLCIVLSRLPRALGEQGLNITGSVYSILCCVLALFIQFHLHQMVLLAGENRLLERLRQEERKQYIISKNAIDDINIKVHDLRHKLAYYRDKLPQEEIDSLSRDIEIYDGVMHTGNEALDVLMTEKVHHCRRLGITLTFTGPGEALSFMSTMDIYSLFGNAVDNAIEAVEKLPPEKQVIDVSIARRGEFVFLSFTNFVEGAPVFLDGLPQTTKKEETSYHGFGVKSMKRIAARYHGELTASVSGGCFYLNIYLQDHTA